MMRKNGRKVALYITTVLCVFAISMAVEPDFVSCATTDAADVGVSWRAVQSGEISIDEAISEIVLSRNEGFLSAAELERALSWGYFTAYTDYFKSAGLISPNYGGSSSASAPAASSNSNSSSTDSGTKTDTSSGTAPVKEEAVPTEDTSVSGTYYPTADVVVLDAAQNGKEIGTIPAGVETTVSAETSNGLYNVSATVAGNVITGYASVDAFATADDYNAAWEETEEVEATCDEDGKVVKTNSLSGVTEEEVIPATGHEYEETDRTEPTCTEPGKIVYTCKICGDSYDEEIPALGHDAGEWVIVTAAGPFTAGLKELQCTRCGEVLNSEVIPQTFPLPLWAVIVIGVGTVGAIVAVLVVVRKKQSK